MFHCNLLGVLDLPHRFLWCELNQAQPAPIHGGGSWFGRVAEQSHLTGYEPNSLIESSSEHRPINFPSGKNSLNTDINDVTTTVAASDRRNH